jgi:hypothetical protein
MTFTKTSEGYASADGRSLITDNGGGMGPQRGSGRWAVTVDGRWVANVDYLPEAKALAAKLLEAR